MIFLHPSIVVCNASCDFFKHVSGDLHERKNQSTEGDEKEKEKGESHMLVIELIFKITQERVFSCLKCLETKFKMTFNFSLIF
jgi:hypothetical protein